MLNAYFAGVPLYVTVFRVNDCRTDQAIVLLADGTIECKDIECAAGEQPLFEIEFITHIASHQHGGILPMWLSYLSSAIFAVLLLASFYRKFMIKFFPKARAKSNGIIIKISGMTCNHCVANVERVLNDIPSIKSFDISLERGEAILEGDFEIQEVLEKITAVGYKSTEDKS